MRMLPVGDDSSNVDSLKKMDRNFARLEDLISRICIDVVKDLKFFRMIEISELF